MRAQSPNPAVLLAGGTGALGGAVLRALLAAGRPVVATWRQERERDRVEQELDGHPELSLVRADVLQPKEVTAVVDGIEDLGAVVNLVGGYAGGRNVDATDPGEFDRMLALNLRPSFLLAHAAMPRLVAAGGGAFVAVSARAAVAPFAGAAGYITAKAGLLAFVRALHAEYGPAGVRANALLPGVIDTPANRRAQPEADHAAWVSPEQIAQVIAFLVDQRSAAIAGAGVPVTGHG